jgi:hypothetical protein
MSPDADSPRRAGASCTTTPKSPTPLIALELRERLDAQKAVGACTDSDDRGLSSVATLVAPTMSSASSTNEESRAEAEIHDVGTLMERLRLNEWRCGARKPDGEPCQVPIYEKQQVKIHTQLEQLLTHLEPSENLDDELEKLVMLVHCRYHDHGNAKEDRLELWSTVLPQAATTSTITMERQIEKMLLRQVEQKCRGTTQRKTRCGQNIGGQRVENCRKTIAEILQPDVYEDADLLEGYLKVLEANMYCRFHVGGPTYMMVMTWKTSIIDTLEKSKVELSRDANLVTPSVESDTGPINSETVSEGPDVTGETLWRNPQLPTPRSTRSLSPEFYHSPSKFWPPNLDTSPFKRLPRRDSIPNLTARYDQLKAVVTRNLAKTHHVEGYVYLYEVEGNEGFIKLGYTKNLEKRHEEWAFDCNRKTKLLYPLLEDDMKKVPNAPRVEALCHSELDHCRVRVDCSACLKEHVEWFETTPDKCIHVIKKWSQWMRTNPFEEVTTTRGTLLKKEQRDKTKNMVEFMESVSKLA